MGRGPHTTPTSTRPCRRSAPWPLPRATLAPGRNSPLPTLEVTTADHILFGTDWPAAAEPIVVRNIANLTSFEGFTSEQLRGVEREKALRLFPRLA
ncbi:MAG: hypothetical protein JWR37_1725 [Mycobacterium sp.]|nr:hypothetical protein [Mycobacterium sp.]